MSFESTWISPFALPGECPRCCGDTHPAYRADEPCDGRLVGGLICGYVTPDTSSSASRQHYIDTGRYLTKGAADA